MYKIFFTIIKGALLRNLERGNNIGYLRTYISRREEQMTKVVSGGRKANTLNELLISNQSDGLI